VLPRNVAKLVRVTVPKYKINRGLTVAEARRVLKAAADERLYALYVLALCLGLRRGELLGPRWSDIDLDAESLVRHADGTGQPAPLLGPHLEGGRNQRRPVPRHPAHVRDAPARPEGAPPHVVREIVGHSDIEVMMTIYAHASLDEKRSALGELGDALG
jgi:integrase